MELEVVDLLDSPLQTCVPIFSFFSLTEIHPSIDLSTRVSK